MKTIITSSRYRGKIYITIDSLYYTTTFWSQLFSFSSILKTYSRSHFHVAHIVKMIATILMIVIIIIIIIILILIGIIYYNIS